jgi:hypothetical protein
MRPSVEGPLRVDISSTSREVNRDRTRATAEEKKRKRKEKETENALWEA